MATIDPEQVRSRLVETYSRQTDAELVEVAAQAYELTDVARTALRAELTKKRRECARGRILSRR